VKCSDARRFLSPYLSSELDEKTAFEIARHLEACAACAARFRAEEDLERAVVTALRCAEGDEERVFHVALERALGAGRRSWRLYALLSGAAAVLVLLALVVWKLVGGEGDGRVPAFVAAAARDHRESASEARAFDVGGSSLAKVDEFLGASIGTTLGAIRLGADWTLEGARRCHLDGVDVGLVKLSCRGSPVSLFVSPPSALERWKDARTSPGGCSSFLLGETNAVLWTGQTAVCLAVGEVDLEHLRGLFDEPRRNRGKAPGAPD